MSSESDPDMERTTGVSCFDVAYERLVAMSTVRPYGLGFPTWLRALLLSSLRPVSRYDIKLRVIILIIGFNL
jgi:hypothetical protein